MRYEERNWGGREMFEANCGSCGSFAIEGGATVGERAMFYAGIGRLFGDAELVASIKTILKESARTIETLNGELVTLRNRIANPLTTVE